MLEILIVLSPFILVKAVTYIYGLGEKGGIEIGFKKGQSYERRFPFDGDQSEREKTEVLKYVSELMVNSKLTYIPKSSLKYSKSFMKSTLLTEIIKTKDEERVKTLEAAIIFLSCIVDDKYAKNSLVNKLSNLTVKNEDNHSYELGMNITLDQNLEKELENIVKKETFISLGDIEKAKIGLAS